MGEAAGIIALLDPGLAVAVELGALSAARRSFHDLTGLSFDVPAGLAYDPFSSMAQMVVFVPWDGADEALVITLVPSPCPLTADDDGWWRSLESRGADVSAFEDLRRFRSRGRPCLAGVEALPSSLVSRVVWRRGPRLDAMIEHRRVPSDGGAMTTAMSRVVESIRFPSEVGIGRPAEDDELLQVVVEADRAAVEGRLDDVARLTAEGAALGRRTLWSGDVDSLGMAMIVLANLGTIAGSALESVPVMREAEHLFLRCFRAFETFPSEAPIPAVREWQEGRVAALYETLHRIYAARREAGVALAGNDLPVPVDPVGSALLRQLVLLADAPKANYAPMGARDWGPALRDVAVQDALILTSWWSRASAGLVRSAVPVTPELRANALALLQSALTLAMAGGSVSPETADLAVRVARLRAGGGEPRAQVDLAKALIAQAGLLIALGDGPSRDSAASAVEEADDLLARRGGDDARAGIALVKTFLSLQAGDLDEALRLGNQVLAATGAGTEDLVAAAVGGVATALIAAGRATEAVELTGRPLPGASLLASNSLAVARAWALKATGESAQALLTISLALAGCMIGGDAMSASAAATLQAGADLLDGAGERRAALDLRLAAQAVVSLWKASSLHGGADRVALNDAPAGVDLSADLVESFLREREPAEALLVAERARAETLNQALGIEAGRTAVPPPPFRLAAADMEDVVPRLAAQAAGIRWAAEGSLAALGTPLPPEWPELAAVLADAGVAVLVPHPAGDGTILFLVLPDGSIHVERSRASPADLPEMVDATLTRLEAGSALGDGLRELHAVLVEPVEAHLAAEVPLVVVPYRELALVPWSLLQDAQGRHLCESRAVSVVPSLATLALLRARATTRRRPGAAYVAGDPVTSPGFGLDPLPGARAEADLVARAIRTLGTPATRVRRRVGHEATRASFRAGAAGADVVHLACHAALRTPASASPLYLAADGPDDGMLLAPEIAEIGLSDALVFLSACQTGLGRATADGVIGLGRAFIEAGARCVILSLWEVGDSVTEALVRHFAERMYARRGERTDAAGALRAAMLATRDDTRAGRLTHGRGSPLSDHPRNWAPFIALGDGTLGYAPAPASRGRVAGGRRTGR